MFDPRGTTFEPPDGTAWFFEEVESSALAKRRSEAEFALVERTAPAGYMPPLYARGEDETYRVLEGAVTFFIGDETVAAVESDVVVAPAGVARTFRAESADARWLVLTRVRSLDRFRDFGRAISPPAPEALAHDWLFSDEAAAVAALGRANGIELLGAPGTLPRPR
jgi:mannose-6-phosphate isomerase-like protein (cupin superfamily)